VCTWQHKLGRTLSLNERKCNEVHSFHARCYACMPRARRQPAMLRIQVPARNTQPVQPVTTSPLAMPPLSSLTRMLACAVLPLAAGHGATSALSTSAYGKVNEVSLSYPTITHTAETAPQIQFRFEKRFSRMELVQQVSALLHHIPPSLFHGSAFTGRRQP
jgi:hypothetical protein